VFIMSKTTQNYDVLIVGAGPAGLTAALYSSWLGLKTVALEAGIIGGRAWLAPKMENFPGFPDGIKGSELVERMSRQATRFGAEFKTDEEAVGLELKKQKQADTRKQAYRAKTIIIATGTQRKKLQVPGETDFLGRGVSYCSVCDGPLFRGLTVAVVGNGEEAAIDTLFLAEIAREVTIVTQADELDIAGELLSRLEGKANVKIVKGKVTRIEGEKAVKSVKIMDFESKELMQKEVQGVFVSIGRVPMTAILKNAGVETDANGCLKVDRQQRTNVEGVFAAGDCTCGGMQAVTACGEGAMAALKASIYMRKKG
jgi:thioredoxin reductase (NADPH)